MPLLLCHHRWTTGNLIWSLFDPKGLSLLPRCCRLEPSSPDPDIIKRLAQLRQDEVDACIEKTFGTPDEAPLRSVLRGLLRVEPGVRSNLDQARKKGAFALDTSLVGGFKLF